MISRILTLVILLPLALLFVIFCVVNRAPVIVSMDALGTSPQLAFEAPLFVLVLGSMILGVVLGGLGTWFTQSRHRARASRRGREVESLRHEVVQSNEEVRRLREERERERAATGPGLAAPAARPALAGPGAA